MAGAIIIASAIGILLLVLVGYVIVGGTLSSADRIESAQKDMAIINEEQLGTNIDITWAWWEGAYPDYEIDDFEVTNTGNEIINLDKVGVVVIPTGSGTPIYFKKGTVAGSTWQLVNIDPDDVHPNQWDPGEVIYGEIHLMPNEPDVIYVFTPNGVADSRIAD